MAITSWTTMHQRNLHRREFDDPDEAWRLVRAVTEPDARIWPLDGWPPLQLDDGLALGSVGGHGPIRYRVVVSEPDRIRFELTGDDLDGWHEFRREDGGVAHELVLDGPGGLRARLILPLHDALIEELFDDVDARLAGETTWPRRRRSTRVRVLRAAERGGRMFGARTAAAETRRSQGPAVTSRPARASAVVLLGLGALHAAWAAGSSFPAADRATLADAVIGRGVLPGSGPTWAVAGTLCAASAAVGSMPIATDRAAPVAAAVRALTRAVEVTLLARGAAGPILSARASGTRFRRLNLWLYTPLTLGLGASIRTARRSAGVASV